MQGYEWLARSLKASGQTHFFFVDAVLRRTLLELERVGVQPVLAHTEKAAVYMADAYGRVSGRPGVVAAQSVGTANLAAGLQDAYLGPQPGAGADRAQADRASAPQRLSGSGACAAVRAGDEARGAGA